MPTPLDRALNSKNLFLGFAGMVTAAAAWAIWGGDMFPAEADPTGDPENWTADEMRTWLRVRGLLPSESASRDELLERIKANMRVPRRSAAQ
ncbi:Ish1 domain-containing protein [Aspergillus tubingensis]|uniref:Uncharacterized protein n=1 Tax=Aspergillus costaricaensis CBS 115574 TaxID=1448317 RepID=A0ACD1I811_9EURO|nr:hypothetical protein BO79DRAFT_210187 [Aspergillus costaricaensis CBS 115574]XP_035353751.1 uncharacterized protein AtWU_02745 [Aspergillus tubingensis]RAK86710.1 hypothetical protein BO79DRAFT_210187 [Aspergillus costaricaensis CBS 115574]GFN12947.1 hypothetical protein AtWU_02745 [Aspergillus tubingensis]